METTPYGSQSILLPNGLPAPSTLQEDDRGQDMLGAYESYNAIAYRYAPFNPDALITARGYDFIADLINLAPIGSSLNIVREAALYKGISVAPKSDKEGNPVANEAMELAEGFDRALDDIEDPQGNQQDRRSIAWEILFALHMGFSVSSINWRTVDEGPQAGMQGLAGVYTKPCKQIGFDLDLNSLAIRNIVSYTPLEGYKFDIPVEKCLVYTFQGQDNLPYGRGIGRRVYKHGWSLDFGMKFMNLAVEMFGVPFILAFVAKAEIATTRKALKQMRDGAPAVFPLGAQAELEQMAAGGIGNILAALEWHAQQCSVAYLHSTLTTQVDDQGGARALGEVQQDTQEFMLAHVRRDLEKLFKRLAQLWVRYNYGRSYEQWTPNISCGEVDSDDIGKLTQAFTQLSAGGFVLPTEPQFRRKLKLEPADPQTQAELATRQAAATQGAITAAQPKPAPQPAQASGNSSSNQAAA